MGPEAGTFVVEPTSEVICVSASHPSGCVASCFVSFHRFPSLLIAVAEHWGCRQRDDPRSRPTTITPMLSGWFSTPCLMAADGALSEPTTKATTFRIQGLRAIACPG